MHQFAVLPDTGDLPLIQYDDLICVQDRVNTLGHDQYGSIRHLCFEGMAERSVCFEIQR